MRKRVALSLLLGSLALSPLLAESRADSQRLNWGVRLGVNAPFIHIQSTTISGKEVLPPHINTSVGSLGSLFLRYNWRNSFLQVESAISHTHYNLSFEASELLQNENYTSEINIPYESYAIGIPIIYGYHFINEGNYKLFSYSGLQTCYLLNEREFTKNSFVEDYEVYTRISNLQSYLLLGVGTSISNLILDFRYQFGLIPYRSNLKYSYSAMSMLGTVSFVRNVNQLSFSIGLIF